LARSGRIVRESGLSSPLKPHGLAAKAALRRLFGNSGHIVAILLSLPIPNTAKAPGFVGLGAFRGLVMSLKKKNWWWTQSRENQSPLISLFNRENTGNLFNFGD
jgi:hypothetical protein|tara:strand:- start:841 stop:1152 length:312 start_codon:yes stop_codon:yes gene_type:complete